MERRIKSRHPRIVGLLSALTVGAAGLASVALIAHPHKPTNAQLAARPDSRVNHAVIASSHIDTTTSVPKSVKDPVQPIENFELRTIMVDGVLRQYYVESPKGQNNPVPLVIALHGLNSTGRWMAINTGLGAAARESRVALVVPVALGPAWNDGRLGTNGPDDQAFIDAVVQKMITQKIANPHRVTITGFSNGAEMALTMASLQPKTFAAVVSVSGELPSAAGSARPTSPIPAYFTHGMNDHVQPYNGRTGNSQLFNGLLSEDDTVSLFVKVNNSQAGVTHTLPPGSAASGPLKQITYAAGPKGAPVTLYEFPDVGHKWPAAADHKPSNDSVVPVGFSATSLIMKVATTSAR